MRLRWPAGLSVRAKNEEGERKMVRGEGGRTEGVDGVSRRGDREEDEPPARSRRWRPPSARVRLRLCLLAEEDDERRGRWAGLVKLGRSWAAR